MGAEIPQRLLHQRRIQVNLLLVQYPAFASAWESSCSQLVGSGMWTLVLHVPAYLAMTHLGKYI